MIPCRYVFAVLGNMGMAICYALRVNINLAIVSMVNHTAADLHENTSSAGNSTRNAISIRAAPLDFLVFEPKTENEPIEDGPLMWSRTLQGIIISSYFWGYLVGLYPGGRISELFSAKWMFYIGGSVNIVGTMLIPPAAYGHYSLVIVIRIVQGITGGFIFPAAHVLLSKWAPPDERSIMGSLVYTGTSLGTVVSMLLTGTIAGNLSWEATFYIMAGCSVPWMVLWPVLVYDRPQVHPRIKEKELVYLTETLGGTKRKVKAPVPWKSILKSVPVYTLIYAHFATGWTCFVLLVGMPLFMHLILRFNIQENGLLSALPFLTLWIVSLIYGRLLDLLIARGKITVTWARKQSTAIATVIPIICLLTLCYIHEPRVIGVILMTIAVTSIAGGYSGVVVNHIDLSMNFAGTLMGITNTVATMGAIFVPLFLGWLIDNDPSIKSWRIIFWVTIGLNVVELTTYTIFGSGKEQKWNKIEN